MGKEKDMDKELSGMLRGVPPQNIMISFGNKPAKSLADHVKEQEEKEKPKVTAISTALEITGLVVALAFVVGNDLFAFPFDNVAIPVILGMLVAKFDELFGSCDTVA